MPSSIGRTVTTAPRVRTTRPAAFDPAAAAKKLERLFDRNKLTVERTAPDVTGLKSFPVKNLCPRALNDTITSGRAFIDQRSGRVYLKVSGIERLPWEGIQSRFTTWYSAPLSAIGR